MKKLFLTIAVLAFVISSCNKGNDHNPTPDENKSTSELVVPDSFNWQTIANYDLVLTAYASSTVEIVSMDGNVYQKAFLTKNVPFNIQLAVPTYETKVRLLYMGQDIELILDQSSMEYIFN